MRYLLYIETFLLSSFVLASPTQMFGRGDCPKVFNYNQRQISTGRNHSLGARSGGYITPVGARSGGYITARHVVPAWHIKREPSPGQRANYGDAAFRK